MLGEVSLRVVMGGCVAVVTVLRRFGVVDSRVILYRVCANRVHHGDHAAV